MHEHFVDSFKAVPVGVMYTVLAMIGGTARYLVQYTKGTPFKLTMFVSNILISGFSGYMFAIFGTSMDFPPHMLVVMAGIGGFLGVNAIELIVEHISKKVK